MALQQPASSNFWREAGDAGAAPVIDLLHLVDDGAGGYKEESVSVGNDTAERALDDAGGGFTGHTGAANPSSLAELHMIDDGYEVTTYE